MGAGNTQQLKRIHNLLAGGFLILAAVCFLGAVKEPLDRRRIQKEYESLAEMAGRVTAPQVMDPGERGLGWDKEEDAGETAVGQPVDFKTLSAMNPDTVGWIRIPDTGIDYPIVQGSDNQMYLNKSFSGESADAGCIFLDFESRRDLRGYNNVLYGHNMKNGTMFRDLVFYKDEEYFREHPYFEIYTPKETICLKAVSCYYIQEDTRVRRTVFRDQEDFQVFVREMIKPCPYAVMPQKAVRNLYTLVTCSYEAEDARTILFAVEAD